MSNLPACCCVLPFSPETTCTHYQVANCTMIMGDRLTADHGAQLADILQIMHQYLGLIAYMGSLCCVIRCHARAQLGANLSPITLIVVLAMCRTRAPGQFWHRMRWSMDSCRLQRMHMQHWAWWTACILWMMRWHAPQQAAAQEWTPTSWPY